MVWSAKKIRKRRMIPVRDHETLEMEANDRQKYNATVIEMA